MRSSNKSRSRNKNQNRRPSGNIVNRVFDSSGPDGKVRGTPQQIIEKYQALTRDAQLSGDRVAAENFQQHAEHYTRLLGEAQREMNAKREQQDAEAAQRREQQEAEAAARRERQQEATPDPAQSEQPDIPSHALDVQDPSADSGLVETPEAEAPKKPRRPRKKPQAQAQSEAPQPPEGAVAPVEKAAEKAAE